MKSVITRSLAVSLAVAAAIALPATVKAQSDSPASTASEATFTQDLISTETNWCVRVPGYGLICY